MPSAIGGAILGAVAPALVGAVANFIVGAIVIVGTVALATRALKRKQQQQRQA